MRFKRIRERLDRRHHVIAVAMDQPFAVEHHSHVASPEHEVAALQQARIEFKRRAELALHHVGVARARPAAGLERRLH
jgi:hypothetical protein